MHSDGVPCLRALAVFAGAHVRSFAMFPISVDEKAVQIFRCFGDELRCPGEPILLRVLDASGNKITSVSVERCSSLEELVLDENGSKMSTSSPGSRNVKKVAARASCAPAVTTTSCAAS